jgi:hypothetical protein
VGRTKAHRKKIIEEGETTKAGGLVMHFIDFRAAVVDHFGGGVAEVQRIAKLVDNELADTCSCSCSSLFMIGKVGNRLSGAFQIHQWQRNLQEAQSPTPA